MGKCILAGHPQAGGQVGYGTYTGTSPSVYNDVPQTINLGVTPKWVLVVDAIGCMGVQVEVQGGSSFTSHGGLALENYPAKDPFTDPSTDIVTIVPSGFTVRRLANSRNYNPYRYIYGY